MGASVMEIWRINAQMRRAMRGKRTSARDHNVYSNKIAHEPRIDREQTKTPKFDQKVA
jgi:hypothetical protein